VNSGFTHESPINKSIDWFTPPEIFDALALTFDLDPCSAGEGCDFVPARQRYTITDDGLNKDWSGLVWMNPPYGRHTPVWLHKLQAHGNGIALVFARTDTRWFASAANSASVICFITRRVSFYKGNKTERNGIPPAGSMLIAYGEQTRQAVIKSNLGICMSKV